MADASSDFKAIYGLLELKKMRREIEGKEYGRNFHSTIPFSIDSNLFCSSTGGGTKVVTMIFQPIVMRMSIPYWVKKHLCLHLNGHYHGQTKCLNSSKVIVCSPLPHTFAFLHVVY
jgi:hypothetical protein